MSVRSLFILFLSVAAEAPGLTDPTTVLPSEAPPAVRLAAAEFAKYWKSVTGRALVTAGIEAFRPQTPLNARTYRRFLGDAREAAAR